MSASRVRHWICALCVLLAVGTLPSPSAAQSTPRERLEARVREAFQDRLRARLDLDAEQARGLEDVMSWSEGQRREIALDNRQIRLDTERWLQDGGTDSDRGLALLQARVDLQAREAELFAEEQARLLDVLTPVQVLRFYEMREEFVRRVQQLRRGRAGERPS